jgi:hypothetical protein
MTQPQRQDERVLDYLYGELDESERAEFEARLHEDAELRREVDSLKEVRRAFRGLPKVEQSAESVKSMTALLMQQAAKSRAAEKPAAPEKDPAADSKPEGGAGGKILSFRGPRLRRIFTNPAAGIFAAAAAALFFVVVKTYQPPASLPVSDTPLSESPAATVTFKPSPQTPPSIVAAPPAPAAEPGAAKGASKDSVAPPAEKNFIAEGQSAGGGGEAAKIGVYDKVGKAVPIKKAFDEALQGPMASSTPSPMPKTAAAPAAAPPPAALAAELKPVEIAQTTRSAKKKAESAGGLFGADDSLADGRGFVNAPPPEAPPSPGNVENQREKGLGREIAAAQARRQERIVEELTNQELGSMPAGAGAAPHQAAPPPPPVAAESENTRYAQRQAPSASAPAADEAASAAPSPEVMNQAPSYAQNAAPRRAANAYDGDSSGAALLATAQEQLQKGRCSEAQATLHRLEQNFPSLAGLSEARAQWQRTCAPALQNMQQQGQPAVQLQGPMPAPSQAAPLQAPPKMQNFDASYERNLAPSSSMNRSAAPFAKESKAAPMRKRAAPAKPTPKPADAY